MREKSEFLFLPPNLFPIDLLTWLWFHENHCYIMLVLSLMKLLICIWLISGHVEILNSWRWWTSASVIMNPICFSSTFTWIVFGLFVCLLLNDYYCLIAMMIGMLIVVESWVWTIALLLHEPTIPKKNPLNYAWSLLLLLCLFVHDWFYDDEIDDTL